MSVNKILMRRFGSILTRAFILLPFFYVLCSSSLLDEETRYNFRILSLSDVTSILFSEIRNEFGTHFFSVADIEQRWQDAITYEWNHILQDELWRSRLQGGSRNRLLGDVAEDLTSDLNPYLCCCFKDQNLATEERCIDRVRNFFGKDFITLYNNNERLCVIVSSTASAVRTAPITLSFVPLIPEMKLLEGTVESIQNTTNPSNRLNIMLCPTYEYNDKYESKKIEDDLLEKLTHESQTQGLHRFLRLQDDEIGDIDIQQMISKDEQYHRSTLWSRLLGERKNDSLQCFQQEKNIITSTSNKGNFVGITVEYLNVDSPELISISPCLLSIAATLATQKEVCAISLEPEIILLNEEVQWILQSGKENKRPWFESSIDGTGQVVGLSDSGLDVDNCYFHDDSETSFNKDGNVYPYRRKVIQYHSYADDSDMISGHGTHVAGTIAGYRQMAKSKEIGVADGIAKGAKLAFFDVATNDGKVKMPVDPGEIFIKANEAGAYIHSVSWGSVGAVYMQDEVAIDKYLYENPDNLVCTAAGNFGRKGDISLASPSTAKNIISVGSSFKQKNYLNSVTDFSSRGPTMDGRMKPEVMAPGDSILSACAVPSEPGACDENGGVKYSGGTSMSAPAVCGAAAIVRQYFEDGFYTENTGDTSFVNPPSGPLIKAVLINGAIPLVSNHKMEPIYPYDNNQGFGRISLIESMSLKKENELKIKVVNRQEITSASVQKYTITIDKSKKCDHPLRASLVWYDPPSGQGCTRCLLNDLNLYITTDSKTYYSNGLTSEKDNKNNSERVEINVEDGAVLTIHVEATDLVTEVQMYAMVISGCLGKFESLHEKKKTSDALYPNPIIVNWDVYDDKDVENLGYSSKEKKNKS